MVSNKIVIKMEAGLHARPAGVLAKAAGKCRSKVTMLVGERTVQVKSILNIMAAAVKCGTEIELCCDGETEAEDLKVLTELIESGLGES